MTKIILPNQLPARGSDKDAAIVSLRYLSSLHSRNGLNGKHLDPHTFHLGLLQIRPDFSYFEAIAYWTGDIHPSDHDLLRYADDIGLAEHFRNCLRKKPTSYTPPLRRRLEL